jgi:hypothetical protein
MFLGLAACNNAAGVQVQGVHIMLLHLAIGAN